MPCVSLGSYLLCGVKGIPTGEISELVVNIGQTHRGAVAFALNLYFEILTWILPIKKNLKLSQ